MKIIFTLNIDRIEQGLPQTDDVEALDLDEEEERMQNWGFTADQVNELLSFGVKPWEDDAFDFLEQLSAAREEDEYDYDYDVEDEAEESDGDGP